MTVYRVEVETTGHEVYYVNAETEAEARRIVNEEAIEPSVSEVLSGQIVGVEEES